MLRRHRLIAFDFDGTLVDSQRAITEAMALAFLEAGREAPPACRVRRVVGLRLEEAIARLLADDENDADAKNAADAGALVPGIAAGYRRAFAGLRARPDFDEPLVEGAREVIEQLDRSGVFLAIATGKNRRGLVASLERHGLGSHFTTLKTAEDGPGKPHPGILLDAMAEVGVEPEETLLIGDTIYDIQMAQNAGADALGVAWGYHETGELLAAGAAAVLNDFAQLWLALTDLEEET